jgi:hypothetical protein
MILINLFYQELPHAWVCGQSFTPPRSLSRCIRADILLLAGQYSTICLYYYLHDQLLTPFHSNASPYFVFLAEIVSMTIAHLQKKYKLNKLEGNPFL